MATERGADRQLLLLFILFNYEKAVYQAVRAAWGNI
jgi:hypothetical protein